MNVFRDYVVSCNAFIVGSKYIIKELSIIGAHTRHHFRVKIPQYILRKPISRKERDSIWYCERHLHNNAFDNGPYDINIQAITTEIKRLQHYDPYCKFFVKGDDGLQTYLQRVCRVRCEKLIIAKCAPPPVEFKFHFCPNHNASMCSYYKAVSFFNKIAV